MSVNVMKLDGFLGRVAGCEKKRAALGDAARKRRKNVSDRLPGKETILEETPIACLRPEQSLKILLVDQKPIRAFRVYLTSGRDLSLGTYIAGACWCSRVSRAQHAR
jgi:hypothetical protein